MPRWIRDDKRLAIYLADFGCCVYCGANVWNGGIALRGGITLDHVIPRSQGGKNDAANLVTCCFTCNSERQDKAPPVKAAVAWASSPYRLATIDAHRKGVHAARAQKGAPHPQLAALNNLREVSSSSWRAKMLGY